MWYEFKLPLELFFSAFLSQFLLYEILVILM